MTNGDDKIRGIVFDPHFFESLLEMGLSPEENIKLMQEIEAEFKNMTLQELKERSEPFTDNDLVD